MLLLLSSITLADQVAVLPFDGYGVTWDDAQIATEGLRVAFLEHGAFTPIDPVEQAERAGAQDDVEWARAMTDTARRALDQGESQAALVNLTEALAAHERAWSGWVRRVEVADAHYLSARAQLEQGRTDDAVNHLISALLLYPGYERSRARNVDPDMQQALREAGREVRLTPPRRPGADTLAPLARSMDVELLVVGHVSSHDGIWARLLQDGLVVAEVRAPDTEPPPPGSELYLELVTELLGEAPVADARPLEFEALPPPSPLDPEPAPQERAPSSVDTTRVLQIGGGVLGSAVVAGAAAGLIVWLAVPDPAPATPARYDVVVQ
jgi:hypothetical protein